MDIHLGQALRHGVTSTIQTAHDRPRLGPQRLTRLTIGQPDDIDGDDGFTQPWRQLRHGRVYQRKLPHRHGGVRPGVDHEVDRLIKLDRLGPPLARGVTIDPRVAEHAEQVCQIIVSVQEPRPPQNAHEGLLDEVLGILARPAQRIGSTEQTVPVVGKSADVELPPVWTAGGWRPEIDAECLTGWAASRSRVLNASRAFHHESSRSQNAFANTPAPGAHVHR